MEGGGWYVERKDVKKWRRNRRKETVSFDGFSSIF
jgi:hypothetical protein